jgi:hypothetical protein
MAPTRTAEVRVTLPVRVRENGQRPAAAGPLVKARPEVKIVLFVRCTNMSVLCAWIVYRLLSRVEMPRLTFTRRCFRHFVRIRHVR